jgi:hypothetical protein
MVRIGWRGSLALALALAAYGPAAADEIDRFKSSDTTLLLGKAEFPGGKTMELTAGIGSGLFHAAGDPATMLWTVSDRGPNIDCAEAEKITGATTEQLCHGDDKAKVFPLPGFTPSIYRIELGEDGTFRVASVLPLLGADGTPITGISNPLTLTKTEQAFDSTGQALPLDPGGLDTESLVRLSDGTFWIAEEYGPSLVHVAADGKIIERLVPAGLEADLAKAPYPVRGALPAILMKRALNRGLESVALSADGKRLYILMQNPLANPDQDAYKTARMARLLELDAADGKVVGEYVYMLDPPETFRNDKSTKQNDVRLSELTVAPSGDLVALERIGKTTKLHLLALDGATNIAGGAWDDDATAPSLEQLTEADLAAKGIVPLGKRLLLDSADHADLPAKIEGVSFVDADTLILVNDNDFGIDGATTEILRMKVPTN